VLFPPPTVIIAGLADLTLQGLPARSELLMHAGFTLLRVILAFLTGTLAGILVGLAMGASRYVKNFLDPMITVLMPIPGIALAPLFILWFGFGDVTIISLGALSAFFPIVYSTLAGVRSIDSQLVRAARIMGAGRMQVLFSVNLPWAAGYVLNGVKIGLARCWMTVVAVEFVAATNWGLGYMIWNGAEYLRSDIVYGGILLLIMIYVLLERGIINLLEKNTIQKWGMIRGE
jgi:NitT/TauT family transport system permease protein